MSAVTVRLGDHEYVVVPQRIGRLQHELGETFATLGQDAETPEGSGRNDLTGSAWRLLRVFVPGLMPEHEFVGFASQNALDSGEYDASADRSPNPEEIETAVRAVLTVNRIDLVKHLGKVIPPQVITGLVREQLGAGISTLLSSSPSVSGDSPPTTP